MDLVTGQKVVEQCLLGMIPLSPLVGFLLLSVLRVVFKGEKFEAVSGYLATIAALSSFLVTINLCLKGYDSVSAFTCHLWSWISVEPLKVDFALKFDKLAAVMTLVVTGVGSLIHLYAVGYMSHDDSRSRFFCYLNLFLFSMLLLVLGDNLLVMFVGWEGVGLCSYLLIGFWYKEMPNAVAGQKAFVVNRIGDAGFLLGIFTLFYATHTINFSELDHLIPGLPPAIVDIAACLLFIGAVGKSAQLPLFVWLPDAMAGPTPVSALIHAATMVTAGIYMITRMAVLYSGAPNTLLVISIIGTATAFIAATIALTQRDIKKVLAYSTVSQLGYMFMALGAGAFSNGIYHVVTHAFFKALLFMAAGSVIVGCHHEQDMRHFGGLWKKMPFTFIAYLAGTYAIAGLWPASGFFSKDAILWTVFSNPGLPSKLLFGSYTLGQILWGFGLLTAFMTAFYMTRSLVLTFFGTYRGHAHPHESPWTMVVPLMVLVVPSLFFAILYGESLIHLLTPWTRADMALGHDALAGNYAYHLLEQVSLATAAVGVLLAVVVYLWIPKIAEKLSNLSGTKPLYELSFNKWYIDELYQAIIVSPLSVVSSGLFKIVDRGIIDGSVNGAGIFALVCGDIVRRIQGGRIGSYLFFMFSTTLVIIIFWLVI